MFIHEKSDVNTSYIGEGTRVWQYVVILEGAVIGEQCNICSHSLIESDVQIGNNVTVKSGVYIWDGVRIDDNAFVGPCVAFTNDLTPRSKVYPQSFLQTHVGRGASIGANSTILPGVVIGEGAMVGAGSVVVKDVPANAVVIGNPARIVRYLDDEA